MNVIFFYAQVQTVLHESPDIEKNKLYLRNQEMSVFGLVCPIKVERKRFCEPLCR